MVTCSKTSATEIDMTQNEFNALVNQDIQARVAAAQARYEAELAYKASLGTEMTSFEQEYWDSIDWEEQE